MDFRQVDRLSSDRHRNGEGKNLDFSTTSDYTNPDTKNNLFSFFTLFKARTIDFYLSSPNNM